MTDGLSIENGPNLWASDLPWPSKDGHKYHRGHLGCVSGPPASTGAIRLSARAGLRIGAGLVTLISPPASRLVNASHATAIMVKSFDTPEQFNSLCDQMNCVIIGPGAGLTDDLQARVLNILERAPACVLDADALTIFKEQPQRLFNAVTSPTVLTPHEGEFERLFPTRLESEGRVRAARSAANSSGTVVVLKGSETIIASPDGSIVRNTHASSFLATAGSGDVLTGMIGGLISQGMDAFKAACAGVWLHGDCGIRLGPGLISEDLPEVLPEVLAEFYERRP